MDFSYLIYNINYKNGETVIKEFNHSINDKNWGDVRASLISELIEGFQHASINGIINYATRNNSQLIKKINDSETLMSWLNFEPKGGDINAILIRQYYNWYCCLDTTRYFIEGRIPWNIILAHSRFLKLDQKQTQFHIECIMGMDNVEKTLQNKLNLQGSIFSTEILEINKSRFSIL